MASALAFSLNSRAGLNVPQAKTLNIGLFQILLPVEDMALIWSILNYLLIRDISQIFSTYLDLRQIHGYPSLPPSTILICISHSAS